MLHLKVGYLNVKVRAMTPSERDVSHSLGVWVPRHAEILIDSTLHPNVQASTLMHEIIHACFFLCSSDPANDSYSEEEVCRALDGPLTEVLFDNPHLSKVLSSAKQGRPIVK